MHSPGSALQGLVRINDIESPIKPFFKIGYLPIAHNAPLLATYEDFLKTDEKNFKNKNISVTQPEIFVCS